MKSKSEMIAVSLGKVIFVEMAFLVVVELTQSRNIAKYILKVRLSLNWSLENACSKRNLCHEKGLFYSV